MSEPVISCRALARHYEGIGPPVKVLTGVDLEVLPGESVAIVGASGSGKSTLLHLVGGLDRASDGEVLINGHDPARMSDSDLCAMRNQALGFVYQFHHLLPEFTALENVAMPLLIRGTDVDSARRAAGALLEQVGLGARLEHRPAELSGGERQRAAIARAAVTRPAAVLADEPTGNLDRVNAGQVIDVLLALRAESATALVIVTHERSLAQRMDRILELRDGRLYPPT